MKRVVFIFLLFLAFCNIKVNAQHKLEIGGMIGGSSYQGDAFPQSPFASYNSYLAGMLRFNFNERYSLKLNLGKGALSGSTEDSEVILPGNQDGEPMEFSKDISEVSLHVEYNFFPFTTASITNSSRFSPYIFAGIGTTIDDTRSSIQLPFGLGVKYKLTDRINIGLESGYRKLFSDDIDTTDGSNNSLDDPMGLNESAWINNDWYMVTGFFISFGFGSTEWECNMQY